MGGNGKDGRNYGEKSMAITYKEQHCPNCNKDTSFQEFSSWTGIFKRCMECGYTKNEMADEYEIPTPWEIIND